MKVDFSQRVSVPDSVLFRNLDGEAVLLNLDSEEYFGLDGVGTDIWQAVTSDVSIEEAYDNLLIEYDVDAGQLRSDMSEFLLELLDAGLITVA